MASASRILVNRVEHHYIDFYTSAGGQRKVTELVLRKAKEQLCENVQGNYILSCQPTGSPQEVPLVLKIKVTFEKVLDFLSPKDLANASRVNLEFLKETSEALFRQLAIKTSFTDKEQNQFYGVFNGGDPFEMHKKAISQNPERAALATRLNLRPWFNHNDRDLSPVIKYFPNLTHVRVSSCAMIQDELIGFLGHYPRLRSLDLSTKATQLHSIKEFTPAIATALAKACPELTEINLSNSKNPPYPTVCFNKTVTDEAVIALCGALPGLTSIDVSYCEDLSDRSFMSIAKNCTQLKKLCLSGCDLTKFSLEALIKGCKTLEVIGLGKPTMYCIFSLAIGLPKVKMDVDSSKENQALLRELQNELAFQPKSVLGKLYQRVIIGSPANADDFLENVGPQKPRLPSICKHSKKALIKELLKDSPNESSSLLSLLESFIENNPFLGLFSLMRSFLKSQLDKLSPEERNGIYTTIFRLSGSPQTTDKQGWGEKHCLDNYTILAEALGEFMALKEAPKKKFEFNAKAVSFSPAIQQKK